MHSIECQSFNEAYEDMVRLLKAKGQPIGVRGFETFEVPGRVSWTVTRPRNCWLTWPGRRLNPFFAAAEIFWILSGRGSVEWIARFNENMRQFSDDGETFNAAYGERIFDYRCPHPDGVLSRVNQFQSVVNRIAADPWTRRAVIGLWHPWKDNWDSKDIACNTVVQFLVRDERLQTSIYQRSNDIVWGTPYNMLQFHHLSLLLMGELQRRGLTLKEHSLHTVTLGSLHRYVGVYDELWDCLLTSRPAFNLHNYIEDSVVTRQELDALINEFQLITRLDDLNQILERHADNPYWAQLACLPALWLLRTTIVKERLLEWVQERIGLAPLRFLIKDYWEKQHVE